MGRAQSPPPQGGAEVNSPEAGLTLSASLSARARRSVGRSPRPLANATSPGRLNLPFPERWRGCPRRSPKHWVGALGNVRLFV
jgi:hypothetical protein